MYYIRKQSRNSTFFNTFNQFFNTLKYVSTFSTRDGLLECVQICLNRTCSSLRCLAPKILWLPNIAWGTWRDMTEVFELWVADVLMSIRQQTISNIHDSSAVTVVLYGTYQANRNVLLQSLLYSKEVGRLANHQFSLLLVDSYIDNSLWYSFGVSQITATEEP